MTLLGGFWTFPSYSPPSFSIFIPTLLLLLLPFLPLLHLFDFRCFTFDSIFAPWQQRFVFLHFKFSICKGIHTLTRIEYIKKRRRISPTRRYCCFLVPGCTRHMNGYWRAHSQRANERTMRWMNEQTSRSACVVWSLKPLSNTKFTLFGLFFFCLFIRPSSSSEGVEKKIHILWGKSTDIIIQSWVGVFQLFMNSHTLL